MNHPKCTSILRPSAPRRPAEGMCGQSEFDCIRFVCRSRQSRYERVQCLLMDASFLDALLMGCLFLYPKANIECRRFHVKCWVAAFYENIITGVARLAAVRR